MTRVIRDAHKAVQNALKAGKLTKAPCEECGSKLTVAHHDDYAKPLDVRWLCKICHSQWHEANGPGLNGGLGWVPGSARSDRSVAICIRVSPAQKRRWKEAANKSGNDLSPWIRTVLDSLAEGA